MNKNAWAFIALPLLALLSFGCSTVEKGKRYNNADLDSLKTAFLVMESKANWDIGMNIREALAERGVQVTIGNLHDKPKDVAFYVNYTDVRKWDMTMYLHSLDIQFLDGATDELLASGSFRNSLFHTYPNEREKTFAVIQSMYEAKSP